MRWDRFTDASHGIELTNPVAEIQGQVLVEYLHGDYSTTQVFSTDPGAFGILHISTTHRPVFVR
jgi:hypothetical protein